MRRDAELLSEFRRGNIPPTLRLYQWQQPAVSYGYGQRLPERLVQACEARNLPLVKRPTGGKAVLHGHDLTLAFVFLPAAECEMRMTPQEAHHPSLLRSPRAAYEQVVPLFIEAFRRLGVPAARGDAPAPHPTSTEDGGDCFATPAITDIIHAEMGIKLIGCALRSQEGGMLLQASIPLHAPCVPTEPLFGHPHPEPPFQDLEQLTKVICQVFEASRREKGFS
jgi:lipoate-protein ligase A